jgi:hypothetical protein
VSALAQRLRHGLNEARILILGAQVLLAGVGCVALATILLMTPAARHRLVERGEDTEAFHRFASRLLLAAMVPLALGIAAEFAVVIRRITDSVPFAVAGAVLASLLFFGCWFGLGAWTRRGAGAPRDHRRAA